MADERDLRSRIGRKLLPKHKHHINSGLGMSASTSSLSLPERFRPVDSDEQEDVVGKNMNQSIFQMITAAGAKTDFGSRFEDDSSSSEDEGDSRRTSRAPSRKGTPNPRSHSFQNNSEKKRMFMSVADVASPSSKRPASPGRVHPEEDVASLAVPESKGVPTEEIAEDAQAQFNSRTLAMGVQEREAKVAKDARKKQGHSEADLSKRLVEIFQLPEEEELISEYPCWLLKSVLLQGYIYVTKNYLCFYSYLPKKQSTVLKSGYLTKRGKNSPRYHRFWFVLKGDVLTYFTDPSNLYFPHGHIDLRFAIQANLADPDDGKDTVAFDVVTNSRTFHFKADSAASAKEWVKVLQRVIFRSHNDGDSVKIVMPIENILEMDDSPVLDFADTFKLKVVDNDDSYAIDEYYFSFFSHGKEAYRTLKKLIEAVPEVASTDRVSSMEGSRSGLKTTLVDAPEEWKEDIKKMEEARSNEGTPDPTAKVGRVQSNLSGSTIRAQGSARVSNASPRPSTADSYAQSVDNDTTTTTSVINYSDAAGASDAETESSANRILNRDEFFLSTVETATRPDPLRAYSDQKAVRKSFDHSERRSVSSDRPVDARAQGGYAATIRPSGQTPTDTDDEDGRSSRHGLHGVVKAPVKLAGWMKHRTKKMGSLLASESMGYLEKVSDMWSGGRKHYNEPMGMMPEEVVEDAEDDEEAEEHGNRFRERFALPTTERLIAVYFGYLHRVIPLYGKLYLGNQHLCFRSIIPGTKTKMILPLKDIENVHKEEGFRFGYHGLVVVVRGHEEIFFEFGQHDTREDCCITLLRELECTHHMKDSGILSQEERHDAENAKKEHNLLEEARKDGHTSHDHDLPKTANIANEMTEVPPIVFDDPNTSFIEFKPPQSLRITCLTIGSRGDVQPYIALCKGLLKEGHKPRIATHAEFKDWIEKHGIEFAQVEGDPAELMRICVENGMFTYSFLKEASSKFRGWIDELLLSAWAACQDTDLLIESPSAMGGIHIAEALGIPYFRAFTMPWTRTRAYPHAFAVPDRKKGGAYNYFTYVMFDNVFWKATAGQINRWRKKTLGLPPTSLEKLQPHKVPFLYNFSPHVVGPPLDYSDWIRITGYWFLDEQTGWEPPEGLLEFIEQARKDGKKLVYVGFGSIVVSDPKAVTKTVCDSVVKADVRCILSKGWSDRLDKKDANVPEVPLPDCIFQIQSAPHDWLFQRIDAAVHHGGAGTTGASLRWGLPTIIKPFFGDQFFFGARVEDLGVGICIKKLNVGAFSRALWEATHDERMIQKAKVLGENIRSEDGVGNAIQAIYRDLEYARSLIKSHGEDESEPEEWTIINGTEEGDYSKTLSRIEKHQVTVDPPK